MEVIHFEKLMLSLKSSMQNGKDKVKDPLLIKIIENFCEESLIEFQKLIAKNKMSSHMLIQAKL